MTIKKVSRIGATRPVLRILGVDPSLSCTGYAYRLNGELYTGSIPVTKLTGPARLYYITNRMAEVIAHVKPDLIVYEDYAKGQKNSRVFDIGELGGKLKTFFWENGINVMMVTPTQLKSAITGHGHAEKYAGEKKRKKTKSAKAMPNMRDCLLQNFGYEILQNDEADAFGLLICGELRFGLASVSPEIRRTLKIDSLGDCPIVEGKQSKLKLISNKK